MAYEKTLYEPGARPVMVIVPVLSVQLPIPAEAPDGELFFTVYGQMLANGAPVFESRTVVVIVAAGSETRLIAVSCPLTTVAPVRSG